MSIHIYIKDIIWKLYLVAASFASRPWMIQININECNTVATSILLRSSIAWALYLNWRACLAMMSLSTNYCNRDCDDVTHVSTETEIQYPQVWILKRMIVEYILCYPLKFKNLRSRRRDNLVWVKECEIILLRILNKQSHLDQ